MKKIVLLFISVLTFTMASAGNDKNIAFNRLPAVAQQFVKKHFNVKKVIFAKQDKGWLDTSYEVMFDNGSKIEFDKNGQWTEIKCHHARVPASAVPKAIQRFVRKHYPQAHIWKIEKDRHSYEVKLSNRVEIKFDTQFNVIDVDSND